MFDNPDLVVACVVGDGEAETGPLATAWHLNKFLDPVTDGAVLPFLHINGYKIASPTVFARIEPEELEQFLRGCGWTPYFVEGHEPELMHEAMAVTLDQAVEEIKRIQREARANGNTTRPRWPMIVLKSPKGWTGPKWVDGLQIDHFVVAVVSLHAFLKLVGGNKIHQLSKDRSSDIHQPSPSAGMRKCDLSEKNISNRKIAF